ncbi:hypothetical protein A3D78_02190 [Candidatus Gottesmanbacteria bacterium RIFCSPHIGHO2_02_FULL_39_14]|uniref:Ribbon-helix-helix protein CopG domain-containing protein n=2 Tax=Candidatus Gottesmaniibacteriota TaxID=1752720 RepID=A0A1F6A2U5_9BACT|nr:MAG: hypothetical protein A2153_02000 [Candidatus Gottesmanbacteria bacterium RBG_16_38_7b]OGG18802.1 MAG: hypothetical protein A3D78_02190 [Candidatus Gottesmanbacteria bacterium RIFCSPHIGHO2_02_FULL_39_14]
MKRYQLYLDPRSVKVIDEVTEISDFTRSQLIRETIDAAATRLGNILAAIKPVRSREYSMWEKMIGAIKIKGKKKVNLSESIDEIYSR